jgi:protein-L-isoaspartate(D-aspartate) O-methyltransferase
VRTSVLALALAACRSDPPVRHDPAPPPPPATTADAAAADPYAAARDAMVDTTITARGVTDPRVIAAMKTVPRHAFVPEGQRRRAYDDTALPIGFEQTISQPYIVAAMTEAAKVAPGDRVLEIGTGSGYQAAVLAALGADVYSIEIVEPLAKRTHALLAELGYDQLHLRIGDGYRGWSEAAPFAAIIVTAAPPAVPQPLIDQLAVGGRLVIPVGDDAQELRVLTKTPDGTTTEDLMDVMFVPMTGEAQRLDARSGPGSRPSRP